MDKQASLYSKRYRFKLIFGIPFVNVVIVSAFGIFCLITLAAAERYYFEATGLGLSLPDTGPGSYHNFFILLFSFIILAFVMSIFFMIAIFRPLHHIIALAKDISKGDLTKRAKVIKSNDEMELLTKVINNMLDSIVDLNQKITRERSLAYLGTLVTGLTHEIRNPIASINTLIELIEKNPDDKAKQAEYFLVIHNEIEKLDALIKKLFAFSKPTESLPTKLRVNELLEELCEDISSNPRYNKVRILKQLNPDLPIVVMPRDELHQILFNLVFNASEAVNYDGEIVISSRRAASPFPFQKLLGTPFDGEKIEDFIEIYVKDNGRGFDINDFKELFNPFYTTKQHSTGLGLTIVKKILENYRGKIGVSTQRGRGTTFYIYLPAVQKEEVKIA